MYNLNGNDVFVTIHEFNIHYGELRHINNLRMENICTIQY